MTEPIDVKKIVIGQYADYFDTGMWTMKDGSIISPEDLTLRQLKMGDLDGSR